MATEVKKAVDSIQYLKMKLATMDEDYTRKFVLHSTLWTISSNSHSLFILWRAGQYKTSQ